MRYSIVVPEEVILEIEEIAFYYQLEKDELGTDFKQAVDKAISELETFHSHQIRYNSIRLKQIERFPHLIHYQVNHASRQVIVVTILHPARDSPVQ